MTPDRFLGLTLFGTRSGRSLMKWWLTGSLVGLSLLAVSGRVAGQLPGQAAQQAGWFTDYQAARAAARSRGKPLFVVFRCQP